MTLNYFNILSGADKEMMHSAMLKFLLGRDDFFRKELFPECPSPIVPAPGSDGKGIARIRLEAPYPGKKRIDVEAHSADGKYILIIENKFKAFPTVGQLQEYDELCALEGSKQGKAIVPYLVCFNRECVYFALHEERVQTSDGVHWHIRTYGEILDTVSSYLKREGEALLPEVRYFLEHYRAYLDDYCKTFREVSKNYSLAFKAEKLSDEDSLPEGLSEKLWDTRFWKRLVLSAVGNEFSRGCGSGALERFQPEYNNGNTPEPFLDIITTKDANWKNGKAPRLFIQMQGRELKLFTRELDLVKKSEVAVDAYLNHCLAVQSNIERKPGVNWALNKRDVMRGRIAGKSASFKIYAEELALDVSVTDLVRQLKDFVLRMDAAVTETGPFLLPSA